MSVVLKGTIQEIVEFTKDEFKKKTVILKIDEDSQYPQEVPIDVINDRISILDAVNIGDQVDLSINLRGNKWNEKWYLSANAWKLDVLVKGDGADSPQPPTEEDTRDGSLDDEGDDLPF